MARDLKFQALVQRLQALPPEQHELRLSFAELESLADGPLPRGAWASAYWNNSTVSRKNWMRCGFRARLDRHHCAVVFTRCTAALPTGCAAPAAAAPEPVTVA